MITANGIPDHATIARFRARHEQAPAATFTQVLALCARAGLVSGGVVAADGRLLAGQSPPGATPSPPPNPGGRHGLGQRPKERKFRARGTLPSPGRSPNRPCLPERQTPPQRGLCNSLVSRAFSRGAEI